MRSNELKKSPQINLREQCGYANWTSEMKDKLHELVDADDIEGLMVALNTSHNGLQLDA